MFAVGCALTKPREARVKMIIAATNLLFMIPSNQDHKHDRPQPV
jgi:hypothetical protein